MALIPTRCAPWRTVLFVAAACVLATLSAFGAERGVPLITVHQAEAHRAGPQTFDIAQDARGVLYFGNLHGLLSWDGAWWRLLNLPDDQVALAVASDAKGTVALGMVDDFGFLSHDANGSVRFESLRPRLPAAQRDFGDVRCICPTRAGFLFVTERSLVMWNGGVPFVVAQFEPEAAPRGCNAEGEAIFLRGPKGLHRFDPATSAITPAGIEEHVRSIVRRRDGSVVVATRAGRLLTVTSEGVTGFAPEASEWLKGKLVVAGAELPDRRLILATRQSGLVILTPEGQVEQFVGVYEGLPDAVINDIRLDRDGSLWVAMDGPIVRVELASPVSLFDARRGIRGSAGDVTRYEGRLYAATTHGLYIIDSEGQGSRVPGFEEGAWRTFPLRDQLLISSSRGIHRIRGSGAPELVLPFEGEIYDLHESKADPSRIWLAQGDGLGSIRREGDRWKHEGLVKGVPQYINTIQEQDGVVWCGTTFNGAIRIDGARSASQKVTQYGSGEMNVTPVDGRVVVVHADGEILDIGAGGRLIPHPRLRHVKAPRGFFIAMQDARGDLWINSTPPRVFHKQKPGTWDAEGVPLVSVTAADIQALRTTEDGVVWFASDKGLFRYVRSKADAPAMGQPAPLIRRVVAGENRLLYGGASSAAPAQPVLRHNFGRIRIEFAPASFHPGVLYQYQLDPIDTTWSEWTDQAFIDYTTLAENDYTFRLRARGAAMAPSTESAWKFSVLAPWYRTRPAIAIWILLLAVVIGAVTRVRTRTLRRKAESLRRIVDEKTAELQKTVGLLESANARLEILSMEDDLTGIANRRFFDRALADEWNRARRRDQPLALILLDLDHFKHLNDRRGHPAGDECLRRVGAVLADTVRRSGEVVARYGGEEFGILLPATDTQGALKVAEALREGILALAVPYGPNSTKILSGSCGVASIVPTEEMTPDVLVAAADRALYAAKHTGRNNVKVADDSLKGTWLQDASA
ncbi:MAG: diguanylate cyclase [Thermoanaerobaculia bacterium]